MGLAGLVWNSSHNESVGGKLRELDIPDVILTVTLQVHWNGFADIDCVGSRNQTDKRCFRDTGGLRDVPLDDSKSQRSAV